LKYGAYDYLVKPCTVQILLGKAERAAVRKREREERILSIRMMPYITEREREELISGILEN